MIADDDGTEPIRSTAEVDVEAIRTVAERGPVARRVIVLDWNDRGVAIVAEFDRYMPPGSQLTVVADDPRMTSEMSALSARTNNLALRHKTGDVTLRGTLESLDLGILRPRSDPGR